MPQQERRISWADAALVVALVPVVLLPQLVGGVFPQIATGAAVAEIVALAILVAERFRARGTLRTTWLAAPIALGLVFTLFEWLPLPRAVVALLQPVGLANAQWVTSLLPADAQSHVRSVLSLDPPETAFAAVRLAGALALFIVVAETCRRRRTRDLAYRLLLVTGALMFVVALGHNLLHVQGAWGRFTMKTAFFYAPMVNPNQLARVLGAIALACGARALVVRSRVELLWCAGVAVCCGAGVFLTLSRGAMLAFVAAGVILGFLLWREKRDPSETDVDVDDVSEGGSRRSATSTTSGALVRAAAAQVVVLAAIALGLFLARETVVKEATSLEHETIETSKLALYKPALSLLDDYGRVGVGNNAFGVAFMSRAAPKLFGGGMTFAYPENVVVGTLVEHGPLFGGIILLSVVVVAIALLATLRTRAAFVPLPALAFLLIGDLFDFALESTAGLFVAATLLGIAASHVVDDAPFRIGMNAKRAAIVGAVIAVVVAIVTPSAIGSWRHRLDDRIDEAHGDERTARIEQALAAHPADAQYCYDLAVAARTKRDPRLALKWANRALVLWPTHRAAHIEAARALVAVGHVDQALGEYKAAFESGQPDDKIVRELLLRTTDLTKLRAGLPDTDAALGFLAQQLIAKKRFDDAQVLLDHAATLSDVSAWTKTRDVEVALMRNDVDGAKRRLEPLLKPARVDAKMVALLLDATERSDGLSAAYDASMAWDKRVVDDKSLLQWRLRAALQLGKLNDATLLIDKLRRRAAGAAEVSALDKQEADLDLKRGDTGRALRLLERLAQRSPNDVPLQVQVAQMEIGLGLVPQARSTVARIPPSAASRSDVAALTKQLDDADQAARERRMRAMIEGTAPTSKDHGSSTK